MSLAARVRGGDGVFERVCADEFAAVCGDESSEMN